MPSTRYKIIKHFCRYTSSRKTYALEGEEFRELVTANPRNLTMATPPDHMLRDVAYRYASLGGTPCVVFDPVQTDDDATACDELPVAMFIPGGGFVFHAGRVQWRFCADIARGSGCRVVMVDYPTAPAHTCFEAIEVLKRAYLDLLEHPSGGVALIGDSSGGGLALTLAQSLRDESLPQPSELVLVSPAVSMCYEGTPYEEKRYYHLREIDPVLSTAAFPTIVEWWGAGLDDKDWRISPLYGNLSDLAHMSVYTGTNDVLNIAARKLLRSAGAQNAPITYVERPNMMHDYVVLHCIEGNRDRARICTDLRKIGADVEQRQTSLR